MRDYPLAIDAGPDFAQLARELAVKAPSPFLFTGEDSLQVDVLTSSATSLEVSGSILGYGLEVLPFSFVMPLTPGTTRNVSRNVIGSGWLQTIRARSLTATTAYGSTYVRLAICCGITPNALVLGVIQACYVTALQECSWPVGVTEGSTDGIGQTITTIVTNPPAFADWTYTVPANQRQVLIAVSALFTPTAVAGNRLPRLNITSGSGGTIFVAPSAAPVPASVQMLLSWGAGSGGPVVADNANGGSFSSPIPNDLYLIPGSTVNSTTGGMLAGDQWTNIYVTVRSWQETVP